MEDLLDLYAEPFDPQRPVICVDEYPVALAGPTRDPLPVAPGLIAREDYEYERHGSCALFGAFQPLAGWRTIQVHDRRTAQDFAQFLKRLVDEHFPTATTLRLVLDNLNTHTLAALYDTFPAAEARRITRKLEFHFTPAHGSWLNMLEIEWSVLAQQCLNRHLPDRATVQTEVHAWAAHRNAQHDTVQWRFTTGDARQKMATLSPADLNPTPERT